MTDIISSISQGHLNVWATCQRKFQHYFWHGLSMPTSFEQQSRLQLGERFHLLMQQREMGLDVTDLADSDRNLQRWLQAFETAPPVMIVGERLSEHRRTFTLKVDRRDYLLTAIFDLLILGDTDGVPSARILDWKTHQKAIAPTTLKNDWQTRLYLYILAQTTDCPPERISMTYWFANAAADQPQNQSVAIAYTSKQHAKTHKDLLDILAQMSQAEASGNFAQVPLGDRKCTKCDFAHRCHRVADSISGSQDRSSDILAIADYPEVAI